MPATSTIRKITVWGMIVNIALTAVKLVIGLWFNSQSCVADAVHSLSDCVTDLAIIIGAKYWSEPADANHPHGHRRIEALTTTFIGIALAAVAAKLCAEAFHSLEFHQPTPGWPVFYAALASILVKEILYQVTARVGKAVRSAAVIANAWHHRSDAFSSIPVAITAVLCRIYPGKLEHLDACTTILVSLMLFIAAAKIVWPAIRELADTGASKATRERILAIAHTVGGIREIHEMRTRRAGSSVSVDLHILVDPDMTVREGHAICNEVSDKLMACKELDIVDVLTHLEPWDDAEKRGDQVN